ncbi:META domain-containing protein [Aestuariibaculum sediminum]|uniref:META domain-containing protein n=1 Tax=Aestuariibaculum sediminum TaxID=2770637 RepID=A0A8J6QHB5_9FLAO|nr:META domain-containing protein [Aestuariibaculum sediminum]MBD0831804.1 META domain-containing protein [Aestuariibaculum sediminum]
MKSYAVVFSVIALIISFSCKSTTSSADALYNAQWELEYITGPRMAFDGIYPNAKPYLVFNKENGKVSGSNSCNGYISDFTVDGNTISFGEPGPATLKFCEGGGEALFLKTMKKIDGFSIDVDGKLNLMMGDLPMMRFKNVEKNM